jgi:hypothetical protein
MDRLADDLPLEKKDGPVAKMCKQKVMDLDTGNGVCQGIPALWTE